MLIAPIRSLDELTNASRKRLEDQLRYELRCLMERRSWRQEQLAHALSYSSPASISKLLRGHAALSAAAAEALDNMGEVTSLDISFTELSKRCRNTSPHIDLSDLSTRAEIADVFLASPMASLGGEAAYREERKAAEDICEALRTYCGFSVYFAGSTLPSEDDFDTPEMAAELNFTSLANCRYFVMFVDGEISRPSSVWVEAGYALALRKPTLFMVKSPNVLPYVLRTISQHNIDSVLPQVNTQYVESARQAAALIRKHKTRLFERLDEMQSA